MKIENDPRVTAYALGELGTAECQIFEQELANAGGAEETLNEIRQCADRIREAYAAEPVYAMTSEQRAVLLADAGVAVMPQLVDETELQHSDKILPWVTQPVISEVDKRKIAEALKGSPWRRALPVLGSLGVAAGIVWLAAVVLMHEQPGVVKDDEEPRVDEPGEFMVNIIPASEFSLEDWRNRRAGDDQPELPPYRYGLPLPLELARDDFRNEREWLAKGGLLDPRFEGFRRAAFPALVGRESYETIRGFLLAGLLPPASEVRVDQLINAFRYDYPAPKGRGDLRGRH